MKKKKYMRMILALIMLLLISGVTASAATTVKIAKGGTKQLKVKGTTIKKASSSNKKVATVTKKGKVTAKKAGKTTVTVKGSNNKKYKFKIVVENPSISKKKLSIKQGAKYKLKLKKNTQSVKWTSNKKSVATVSSKGVVTAKKVGKAVITAKVPNGPSYKCKVTVKAVAKKLSDFSANTTDFKAGEKSTVKFTVKASASVTKKIKLYNESGKAVATMHDDGKKGDSKKGDGIYTCKLSVSRSEAGSVSYYAKAGSLKTKKITLYFYSAATSSAKKKAEKVAGKLEDITEKYADASGNVSAANATKVLSEAASYVKQQKKAGEVLWYEVNEDNVVCKLESGLTIVTQPQVSGIDSIGSNVSMQIFTMQPCLSGYSSDLSSNMRLPDNAASAIASEFSNYSFQSSNNLDNGSVTLEKVKEISSNQVVIWHGHGGYNSKNHSYILTGEDFDWDKWLWDVGYWWDCVQDRILNCNETAAFTSKFVSHYCGNMNNSLIYLATCHSGEDSTLANAFLNKGATAFVGNSATIYTTYNTRMQNAILTRMTEVNSSTGNYYTLNEALAWAKSQYGDNDGSSNHAKPVIFGGTAAKNYRFGDVKPGKIDGQVSRADDHSTVISGAKIKIYKGGSCVKSTTSDSSGAYAAELDPGDYEIRISAEGYIGFKCYVTVESNKTKYMETFLMVSGTEGDEGTASGYIRNSVTGETIENVKVEVRNDWNNPSTGTVVSTVYTDSDGKYSVNLPLGNYTLVLSKDGYVTNSFNVVSQQNNNIQQNGTISPTSSEDEWQIILEWGENPRDVDAHMVGTLTSGSTFHTYFSNKTAYDNGVKICYLDTDDTQSYGPETITLRVSNTTPYYYYIYKYAGTGTLRTSGAKITVLKGGTKVATYNMPTNQGDGAYWNVFAIVDGKIRVNNTVTSSANLSYASTNATVNTATRKALLNGANSVYGTEKKK